MKRDEAIANLRRLLVTTRRDFGVRRIALFGSTARGEARDGSDLDILVDFEGHPTLLSYMGSAPTWQTPSGEGSTSPRRMR